MTTLYIEEFSGLGEMNEATSPYRRMNGEIPQTPSLVSQTVAIGVSSVASNAFSQTTYLVRLHTDSICSFVFGTAPVATATNARMAASQTEYFAVVPGQKVAVITNT